MRRLADLWPSEALYEWRRLNSGEQMVVLLYMAGNYGHDFAQSVPYVCTPTAASRTGCPLDKHNDGDSRTVAAAGLPICGNVYGN
ncbi:MAG: hypothetical protein M0C28_05235 [Candidatus Moduliflexus flocculans]|nr:hypothetical protein [Candidatus Moduliflexus flocculans]